MKKSPLYLALGALFALACSSQGATTTTSPDGGPPGTTSPDGGPSGTTPDPVAPPDAGPAAVETDPTAPKDDANHTLGWAQAPLMASVSVVPNRDSAILVVPAVAGAVDYRVITVPDGVKITVDGSGAERIDGSTIHCAGYRQHNAPRAANRELMLQVEVTGLTGPTRLVVEAIDTACPYTGALGSAHVDINATNTEIDAPTRGVFSFFTEAELRSTYGSLILNGHGNNPAKNGQPAPATSPKVLSRTTIKVTPLGTSAMGPTATFFDDFQNE
ncbi:MAG TPA: hypothetical protein VF316_05000, partial [Polyangiaceae bacterium]